MSRDFHLPGRSPVIAAEGMAATSHPLATLAAVDTLRAGGNAVDAAVVAVATLCVVEPHMTGIGGDCFCLVSQPGKPVWGYNGSGRAGAAVDLEAAASRGHDGSIAQTSIRWRSPSPARSTLVAILARAIGTLLRLWSASFTRRFAAAEDGFPRRPRAVALGLAPLPRRSRAIPPRRHIPVQRHSRRKKATVDPFSRARPQRSSRSPPTARARSTKARSPTTWSPSCIAARGSFHHAEDFARHRGEAVTPIATPYRGHRSRRDAAKRAGAHRAGDAQHPGELRSLALDPNGPERFHLVLEAARLAFAVRDAHVADAAYARRGCRSYRQKFRQESWPPRSTSRSAAKLSLRAHPAATPSISRWSTATAWRSRSSTRCIRISAPASAPKRPASC